MNIGPYRVVRTLGAGGMGEVLLAEDTRLQRHVALKVLQSEPGHATTRHVLREARAAARLNHPNIAAVHDVIERDGQSFIVMEYVDGAPLSAVASGEPLPIARVVDIGIELADAIAFAHAQGVVHRDIKPANVMITGGGRVKLLDLGLARVSEPSLAGSAAAVESTTTGMPLAGTPPYMAPEQLLGGEATAASDIYSFGVLLFELLTGHRPFEGSDLMSLVMSIAGTRTPHVRDLRPEVPQSLSDLVAWSMAREPRDRPASAERLRAELFAIRRRLESATTAAVERPVAAPRRRPHAATASALALAVVGLLVWLSSAAVRPAPPPPVVAVLPAVNLSGEAALDVIGAGLMAVVADNLEAAPGLTVVPQGAGNAHRGMGRDIAQAAADLGATYVIDVALQRAPGGVSADARVLTAGTREPVWATKLTGDLLSIERALLAGVGDALQRAGAFRKPLSDEQRKRLTMVPTQNAEAMQAYSEGRILLESVDSAEKVTRSLAAFDRAIALDPQFALAYAGASEAAGAVFRHTRDEAYLKRAADAANRAMELDPRSGRVQYALANVYRRMRKPADAIRHLEVALQLSPENDDAHRLMGALLREERKFDEAAESVRRAIALRPGYWLHHHQLGLTLVDAQRYRDAAAAFTEVTRLRPDYHGGHQALGTALHYAGDVDGAIGHYAHALRLEPSAAVYGNLGYTYFATRQYDKALENYREALKLDPADPVSHRNLADVLWQMGRTADARKSYTDAIALAEKELASNPRDAARVGLVALCEARLGRIDLALRHANEALALAPDDVDAIYNSAAVNAQAGRADKALEQLKRALEGRYPRQLVREDDYFDPIRNDTRFTRLLAGNNP